MKNHKIIPAIICISVLAALSAGGCSVRTNAESALSKTNDSSCGDELRRSMDAMHRAMMTVETSGDADEDFVRLMLPHHEAAVEMAKVELKCGKDPVNRRLAQEIIVEQRSEIDLMNLWLAKRDSRKLPGDADHLQTETKR